MTIDTNKFSFMGGGPYVDKMEAERQIQLYYKNEIGVQVLCDGDTGRWHIVKSKEKK